MTANKLTEPRRLSFADERTHFQLVRSQSPVDVDGYKMGEPTGMVICLACWESAWNIDEIEHESTCPQRHVHSRWWRQTHDGKDRGQEE